MVMVQSYLTIDGIDAPVLIKKNPRARRLTMRINEKNREINITIPQYCNNDAAIAFAQKNRLWLERCLNKVPELKAFQHGEEIPVRGKSYRIIFAGPQTGSGIVSVAETRLTGRLPEIIVNGSQEHAPRRLQDWLKQLARKDLEKSVKTHADRLKLQPKRISVRDQRSRWGSCSTTGALSFSWRLILAPDYVLDYVAAHEVAHLAEMNHGHRFWRLVKQTKPDYETAQDWLKVNGAGLHRYGV